MKRDDADRFLPGTASPPARPRGAQLGNMNSVRQPWATYWRRRALRKEDRWIAPLLSDYLAALAHACTMLVLTEVSRRGLVSDDGPDLPAALARFVSVCLEALVLEHRTRPVQSLRELVRSKGPGERLMRA